VGYPTRVLDLANWAGYGVEGTAPYTGVIGTFDVHQLTIDDSATDVMDAWVGIEGIKGTAGANDLIQAGSWSPWSPYVGSAPVDQFGYTGNTFLGMPVDDRDRGRHRY
jgi:hypothetical protein